ncbi:MAG: aminomethyltransferase beta-barrel domain-containing protein, partial [Candidatus Dormibacteria bacterium]
GVLLSRARAIGATHVATGHYARIGRRGATWTLHRAREAGKDQAYTLHRLDQEQLGAALFPLGGVESKSDVRLEAARLELVSAAKPDSQELCFVDGDLSKELSRRLAGRFRPGPIVDARGRILGEHRGLPFYTVGQRSRLDLRPGRPDAGPLYVLELDAASNRVVVGPVEALQRRRLAAGDCRWVGGAPPEAGLEVEAQLRAHGRAHPARVAAASSRTVELIFAEPAGQVSPGQAAVLYRGDEVIGGGVVTEAGR